MNNNQIENLEANKQYSLYFRGREFIIKGRQDIIRFLRIRDRITKKEQNESC